MAITVTVDSPVPFGCRRVSNTATIDYDESPARRRPDDNQATDTTPIVTTADLDIVKTVVAAEAVSGCGWVTIVAGESVVYCYVVTNPGTRRP